MRPAAGRRQIPAVPQEHIQLNAQRRPWYRTRGFSLTLGICVTLLSLWWAFHSMRDGGAGGLKPASAVFRDIADAFRQAQFHTLPVMWGALALFYVLKAWRWKLLLQPFGSFSIRRDLLPSVMIGFAFNNVLPAHLGEFVRMYVFAREHRVPRTGVLASIALERVFDIIAILSLLALGMLSANTHDLDRSVIWSAWIFTGATGIALTGAAVYLLWTGPFVAFVEGLLERLPFVPGAVRTKAAEVLEAGAHGLSSLKSGRLLAGILLTSVLQWILNGLLIDLSLRAFGIHVSAGVCAIVLGVVAFGVTVPSTPGYFGLIQLCFVVVLKLFVAPGQLESVFAASVYYHMAQWIPVTLVGMVCFLRAGVRMSEIREAEDTVPECADTSRTGS